MDDAEIRRVKEDLAVVRRAMGVAVVQPQHLWAQLALAVAGIIIGPITAFTRIAAEPAVQGSLAHLAYIGLILAPAFVALFAMAALAHQQKYSDILTWLDYRRSLLAASVAAPAYLGYVFWAMRNEMSAGAVVSTAVFLAGLLPLVGAIVDSRRRYVLGWALATVLLGVVAPLGSYRNAGILVGAWLLFGGLSTAAILAFDLRQRGIHDAY